MTATELAATDGTSFQKIPLAQVRESKTNPRKHFDKEALAELAESIRKHGVLQPILVRPIDARRGEDTAGDVVSYELVAGARRLRAAKAAELLEIPAVVRDLDDKQMLEVQVIENLQRADLSPIEEARGYQLLHERFGHSVDELAAKLGKSKAYVYGRMKLCALPKGAQQLLDEGHLDASRALLVARIPVPELADKAAREIAFGRWWGERKGVPKENDRVELMSYRDAVEHVQHEYMLRLKDAPFPTGEAKLVPSAGACATCPKRTGNQRDLFGDVQSADVCTDPKCFRSKCDAWFEQRAAQVVADGGQVLDGKAADAERYSGKLVTLKDTCSEDPKFRTYSAVLGKAASDLKPTLVRTTDGQIVEKFAKTEVAKALREKGVKFERPDNGGSTWRVAERKRKAATQRRTAAMALALPDLAERAEKVSEADLLRFVINRVAHDYERREAIKRAGIAVGTVDGLSKAGHEALAKMTVPKLRALVVQALAGDHPHNAHGSSYAKNWTEACKLVGLNMKPYEAKLPKSQSKAKKGRKKPAARTGKAAAANDDTDE